MLTTTMNQPQVIIYTDGACSGNPGPGGWGAVLLFQDKRKEISGAAENTTNNRMELMAAIQALEHLKKPCSVRLHTDSSYLVDAFLKKWIAGWLKREWKSVKNRDLWERLIALNKHHSIAWIKVKGHDGVIENERCDKLARLEVKSLQRLGRPRSGFSSP